MLRPVGRSNLILRNNLKKICYTSVFSSSQQQKNIALLMPDTELILTDSDHEEFQKLSSELEKELYLRDGDLADINLELNKIDDLQNVILLFINDEAVACGAFREYDSKTAEIKRMYVMPLHRRNNLASKILGELELLAKSQLFKSILLETGKNQPEAIAFYLKHGYTQVENFGKYKESVNSVCFKKYL